MTSMLDTDVPNHWLVRSSDLSSISDTVTGRRNFFVFKMKYVISVFYIISLFCFNMCCVCDPFKSNSLIIQEAIQTFLVFTPVCFTPLF